MMDITIIIIIHQFLNISVTVHAPFAVETHVAEGQCQDEQANTEKECLQFRGQRGYI
jgi:hypothetical protein